MELKRADRDLPGLTVLGLLTTGPRHTYEMHRMMIDFHKDFVTGLPRSMYHSVERLLRDGHVEVVDTERPSGRPERIVYGITERGRAELTERVTRLLAVPDADTDLLVAGLSFAGCLTAAEAVAALRTRLATLARHRDGTSAALADRPAELPRLLFLEAEYALSRITAEHDWVAGVVTEIESGALPWREQADLVTLAEVPPMT
ncbi:PadR family transcriptional regulator [Pseudonocardia sp. CA-107938]|uniref:PadR family transcriptional regulator n=1 Tax=Pseudonocardia sp. CA-107938 TaxID=3240021 RepID=UPI003D8E9B4E